MSESSVVSIDAIHPDLSEFGKHLYKLMVSRGIRSFSALASELDDNDYRMYRQTVTKYARGEQPVPPRFARRLTQVLALTEDDERELAWILYKHG